MPLVDAELLYGCIGRCDGAYEDSVLEGKFICLRI